jgi:hypothetical protein
MSDINKIRKELEDLVLNSYNYYKVVQKSQELDVFIFDKMLEINSKNNFYHNHSIYK